MQSRAGEPRDCKCVLLFTGEVDEFRRRSETARTTVEASEEAGRTSSETSVPRLKPLRSRSATLSDNKLIKILLF
jgi:hypothetical protein